ncbi:MAG: hypothetical protein GY716_19940 [bacterium]|nr:hypothetical protein [bacterium]
MVAWTAMSLGHAFELRPRSLGQVLDLTFRIYRQKIGLFAPYGIAIGVLLFLVGISWQMVYFSGFEELETGDPTAATLFAMFASIPIMVGGQIVIYAFGMMICNAIVDETVRGNDPSAGGVLRKALRRMPTAIAVMLLVSVVTFLGFLFCVVPGVIVSILLVLSVPSVYLENKGPIAALSRSYELVLTRGPRGGGSETNWVRVLVVIVVTAIVMLALNFVSSIPAAAAQIGGVASGNNPTHTIIGPQFLPLYVAIPLHLLGAVLQGLFVPLFMIPWPLLHYDIRARHEGLDLEWRLERIEADAAAEAAS